jgi:hypothetical protein
MGRPQNISLGGRWGMGFISLVFVMGITSTAVWLIPQALPSAPVGDMASSKDIAEAGDLIRKPAGPSGIILSYSFQPWGGALSHLKEPLCLRDSDGHTTVRACCDLNGSSEPGDRIKDFRMKWIEEALLFKNHPFGSGNPDVKRQLHRT